MTQVFDDVGEIVETTLRRLGNRIVLATPLGIGKPNAVINEFYRRAARNPEISLTIVTALSLAKPRAKSELEGRLVGPLAERFYPDYIELDYISAQREGRVPSNIKIHEFYLRAGAYLGIASAQQTYLSSNYTHVARDIISLGLNVIVQSVASRSLGRETQYSLSSNPDLTLDLLPHLLAERAAGRPSTFIGSLNKSLPFMLGDAVISEETFDFLLDHPRYQQAPFAVPSAPINTQDYCLGLYATSLVKDGGTLQLGIGELADSIVYALQLRQQRNDQFQLAYRALAPSVAAEKACLENGGIDSLNRGLYGCSEMFVDGFLDLFQTGVLKRPVYENIELQKLLDSGAITERIDKDWLDRLVAAGLETIDGKTFAALEAGGAFNPGTRYQARTILSASGERLSTDLTDPKAREALLAKAFSKRLNGGTLLHAAFFLGPRGFYSALRELPEVDRQRINMTAVSFVNQIRGADSELRTAQRRHGRFFNTAMLVTLRGAVTSDRFQSGQVVSGVGRQYNLVSMAHDLPDAR